MFFALFGTIVIAGIVAYASERSGFTHNGIIPSMIICIGGASLFYFNRAMFCFSLGSHVLNAIASSLGALVIVPTHYRR